MGQKSFIRKGRQVIITTDAAICTTTDDLVKCDAFTSVVVEFCQFLKEEHPYLLNIFQEIEKSCSNQELAILLLRRLAKSPLTKIIETDPSLTPFLIDSTRSLLHDFVEELYNFWRSFDRYMILRAEISGDSLESRPYRTFNDTVQKLEDGVRGLYRDICENITGDHPRVYRQVSAGCQVGLIAAPRRSKLPKCYAKFLESIPMIRQVWIAPPLILDPPMNKRAGKFTRIQKNIFVDLKLDDNEFVCYPAQVGPLTIFAYFHQQFMGLGCALANLFELADERQIENGPDAIFIYGVEKEILMQFGNQPNIFFDDQEQDLVLGAVPREERFGYFGYLKKSILTLHNVVMMKRGRMPFHGALIRIVLDDQTEHTVLIIGDTATGKSESLEAFRLLGCDSIAHLRIIADDMGSLEVDSNNVVRGYGTESGAFVRLDDLQKGYAFKEIDRAIIMSPQKTNARVVLPVTTLKEILRGYPIDYMLYANNYEEVDDQHPALEFFNSKDQALSIFREGAAMSKGTTATSGLVHSYFANVFGPPEYHKLHEQLAEQVFTAAFEQGVRVGQLRTRLGIVGMEKDGPLKAAEALLKIICNNNLRDS